MSIPVDLTEILFDKLPIPFQIPLNGCRKLHNVALGHQSAGFPIARHKRKNRFACGFHEISRLVGDFHVQSLPLREAHPRRAGPTRP
jgi:hypothetical protein